MRPAGTSEGIPRLLLILAASALFCSDPGVAQTESPPPAQEKGSGANALPPESGFARIVAPALPVRPEAGKGRLALLFSGERRWCTYPDDRLIKPLPEPREGREEKRKNEVFTFGYQFTIAAIKRGAPDKPLMLFESPFFQTASLRPAYKLGLNQPSRKVVVGPSVGMHPRVAKPGTVEEPDTLVPYWEEQNRCVTLPERFDFDLEPGIYDVYVAFDVMNQARGWVHRTADYLTDVPVEEKRLTHLQGTATMNGPSGRDLSLQGASLQPADRETGADGS